LILVIPINVEFDPLNEITFGTVGDYVNQRISPIGIITFGFLWGGGDPWAPCFDPVTTNWTSCALGVTTVWSALYAGVTTIWTE